MTADEKIRRINEVLFRYFEKHKATEPIIAKQFMNAFIKAGIFATDVKDGLPIRDLLRKLDADKNLHQIPYVIPVRKLRNTSWFFAPAKLVGGIAYAEKKKSQVISNPSFSSVKKSRSHSDESYVLGLCDELLSINSIRQHKFPFLIGDPNSSGVCSRLPVDAWYESLNLVVEYNERQHTEAVKLFDRRMTVSGISRGEQRKKYDKRKLEVLAQHGIHVVILCYSDFLHNSSKRLLRVPDQDKAILRIKLNQHILQ